MQATVVGIKTLENVPSASGVEGIGDWLYIIGDDSPYLYRVNSDLSDKKEIPVIEHTDFETGRLPKKLKPDFEALAHLDSGVRSELLIFGSGSKADRRDKLLRVELSEELCEVAQIREFSLTPLYERLRADERIVGEGKLNIEAAVVDDERLLLFQRGSALSPNVVLIFNVRKFLEWVEDNSKKMPVPHLRVVLLPQIGEVQSGFSGATVLPEKDAIVFSASSEDRNDAYLDGKVFGSLVGALERQSLYREAGEIKPSIAKFATKDQGAFTGKIESLTVLGKQAPDTCRVVAVTDNDKDTSSTILTLELSGLP